MAGVVPFINASVMGVDVVRGQRISHPTERQPILPGSQLAWHVEVVSRVVYRNRNSATTGKWSDASEYGTQALSGSMVLSLEIQM